MGEISAIATSTSYLLGLELLSVLLKNKWANVLACLVALIVIAFGFQAILFFRTFGDGGGPKGSPVSQEGALIVSDIFFIYDGGTIGFQIFDRQQNIGFYVGIVYPQSPLVERHLSERSTDAVIVAIDDTYQFETLMTLPNDEFANVVSRLSLTETSDATLHNHAREFLGRIQRVNVPPVIWGGRCVEKISNGEVDKCFGEESD